ncbi:Alpha-protein kinase vwkA [Tetrabaena socialis]|uniref:Alpha-protein kinase vwkA n=1 Tax=Tetrabaena socialis TaxID=47790 RepID=A0A2J7ZVR8_9CHLO|nr:Alpha-protein kinase vwkA [Tetrabaena socialis]|eukprot:PNH04360.1 Alpha-protein kinase vwkA [Tetrabaena socialis]
MEVHSVASFLAGQFNIHAEEQGLDIPEIRYTECDMVCVAQPNNPRRFLLMEPLLTGEMRKYNNNMGVVNPLDPQPHLQAFSHWSHKVTERMLMIVDLQGFKTPAQGGTPAKIAKILLVDPAIHCIQDDFYSKTNWSADGLGFDMFYESHYNKKFGHCGTYCKKLIPTCNAFRLKLHEMAKAARMRSPTPPPRPSPAVTPPRRIEETASTSPLVAKKVELMMKPAAKAHEECALLLAARNVSVPANLHEAITECVKRGLLTMERAKQLHDRREQGNDGRHDWSEIEALFSVPGDRVAGGGGNRGGGRQQGGGRGVSQQGGNRGCGDGQGRRGKQRK